MMKKLAKRFISQEYVLRAQRASCYCYPTCVSQCAETSRPAQESYGANQFYVVPDYNANEDG